MTSELDPKIARNLTLFSQLSGVCAVLVGILAYISWTAGITELSAFRSIPLVPFILAGLSLCALHQHAVKSLLHRAGLLLALLVVLISGHDLLALLLTSNVESLQAMSSGFAFSILNALAANDAISFLLIGAALLLVDVPIVKGTRLADWFTLTATFLSMMTLLGVIFGIPGFCVFISCLRISLLEGVCIALLAIGVLFIRPTEGLASVIASRTAGGVLTRRLLPAAILVPLILGWLRMEGERLQLFSPEIGLTIMVALLVLIFLTVIGLNAWSLDRMDHARLQAIHEMEIEIARRKEVEQRFKDFYSSVSHELRSPITSIQGALQLIEQTPDSAAVKELISTADISCERLIRLINDLLDVKQIEEGKLELDIERVDALELVTLAVEGLEGMAHNAGVRLEIVMDSINYILADEDRIVQVLTNLISNAIKFSPADAAVTIKVSQAEASKLRFAVIDRGPGISEEQQHKIFGKFERIDSADGQKRAGSGLGLAISKGIIEEHKCAIGFVSSVGTGSEFWFELPTAEEETALASAPSMTAEKTAS